MFAMAPMFCRNVREQNPEAAGILTTTVSGHTRYGSVASRDSGMNGYVPVLPFGELAASGLDQAFTRSGM